MRPDRFFRDESGSIAVVGGIVMAALLTVVAVAMTSGDGWSMRAKAQAHLDAAVLAGASLPDQPSDDERIRVAELTYLVNKSKRAETEAEVEVFRQGSTTFSVNGTLVSGQVSFRMKSGFLGFLGRDSMTIGVASAARIIHGTPVCVLGLDQTESATIDMNGQATVEIVNCAAMANSKSGSGISQVGQPQMTAKDIGVTGGYTGTRYSPMPTTGVLPIADPLEYLPVPLAGSCHTLSGAVLKQETRTLTPGTYCGGIHIKSSSAVTLMPGEYIFRDGPLRIDSQAAVSGDRVLLAFLGAGATLEIYAGGSLSVTSPTSGTYTNIQFFGDRKVYGGMNLWMTVIGDSRLTYDGVIYMPTHHVWWAGGSVVEGRSPNYAAIAKKLWFQDNTSVRLTQTNERGIDVDASVPLSSTARLIR